MFSQQSLGDSDPVFTQRGAGFEQARIARGMTNVLRIRVVCTLRVARSGQVIREGSPCIVKVRLEIERSTQGCHRFVALTIGA